MSQQCPICFDPLEVREVSACDICGGWKWGEDERRPDLQGKFTEYRLPEGKTITLCHHCELEEFMVPSGWGHRLVPKGYRQPIDALRPVQELAFSVWTKDKFCPNCGMRLSFLQLLSDVGDSVTPDD